MAKKVLVTGADGFIGSHLTEALVRRGYNVRAFTYYNSFNSWGWLDKCAQDVKGNFEVFSGDIRDPHGVKSAMQGCEIVLHLAALIAIPFSYRSPDTYLETNVRGTLNILQAARDLDVFRVVHTSTSEVYGNARFVPITEEHPLQGKSPYSATKIAADQMVQAFFSSYNLPVTTLRPFNTYGPRQSARAVIPTIITQALTYKGKIRLGSLTPTRDFSYVEDTVSGFIAAMECNSVNGEVINLGSNFEVSIESLANLIGNVMGVKVHLENDEIRYRPEQSEVNRLWADNRRAKELLGWEPKYVGIEGLRRGLVKTIEWFGHPDNLDFYKSDIYNL
jgi:NAD dependent epimerase/dehydratase